MDVDDLVGREWPCPVCEEPREIKGTKKGKPYLLCDGCGVQMFVRYSEGVERMREALEGDDGSPSGIGTFLSLGGTR